MRVRIHHTTQYSYDRPLRSAVQLMRLTPRPNAGQHVVNWRVETDVEGRLRQGEDAFGNITHTLVIEKPIERMRLMVSGEVDTMDTGGVLKGAVERFAPAVFLRETELTETCDDMRVYVADVTAFAGPERLDQLHALLAALHRDVEYCTTSTASETTARQAFALKKGVCQDLAHMFIGMARWIGAPARYVSGHLLRKDGLIEQDAAHAWVEAFIEPIGWVGFDPVNGLCPTDAYVRVASALDYLGAAPVRGSRVGGGEERMDVSLSVAADPDWHTQ
jgi:transglutaminase-like putative cysteine protease